MRMRAERHSRKAPSRMRLALLCVGVIALQPSFGWAQSPQKSTDEYGQQVMSQQQLYCLQLEKRLAQDWQHRSPAQDQLPRIEAQLARADQDYQRNQSVVDHADCFDYFLFTKSWRNSPQCNQIRQQLEQSRQALAELERQRQAASSAEEQNTGQSALIAELARNKCGPQYERAQQQTGSGFGLWNDNESMAPMAGSDQGGLMAQPYATYRTICVRMCDGYYFPISFATTQTSFERDSQACQSQCASPAKLYYYQNPGGEVDQAVALDGTPYTGLHNAFRYRKELVKNCTCRQVPDAPATADMSPAPAPTAPASQETDAGQWQTQTTGGAPQVGVDPQAKPLAGDQMDQLFAPPPSQ
jgi:Protein of unknown function (DUF2865)